MTNNRGEKIRIIEGRLEVPNYPIIPFIEGDGIGPDIMNTARMVWDSAVKTAFNDNRRIIWKELYAGEKAFDKFGTVLPKETLQAIVEYKVAIKGPLITPIGAGYRSINVKIRQELDLFAGIRPSQYYPGVPSPLKHPEQLNVVIFRENTEDVYAGIEWRQGSQEAREIIELLDSKYGKKVRVDSGIGIKPISEYATKRLVRKAIQYALDQKRPSVTLGHKGNIMKFTEGAFKTWGYEVALDEFRDYIITEDELWDQVKGEDGITPIKKNGYYSDLRQGKKVGDPAGRILLKDRICDQLFQQILLRPSEYSVIAVPNLNGDYLSEAAAAQVGGLGLAPGANIGEKTAVFEPVHGSAPKYAGLDKVNPTALILSGAMMFEHLGWTAVVNIIKTALGKTISQKQVTYDLARQIKGANELKCSEFGYALINNFNK